MNIAEAVAIAATVDQVDLAADRSASGRVLGVAEAATVEVERSRHG